MATFLTNFHFLRPWLLTLLIPAAGLVWYALLRQNSRQGAQALIADHLLKHLMVGRREQGKIRPVYLLVAFWIMVRRWTVQGGQTGEKEPGSSRHSFESRRKRTVGPESMKKRSRCLKV